MVNFKQSISIYGGIFLISLSTLMVEITLTKIFSVTLWYHFSYMVVSLALFGIGFGGLLVYHFQDKFKHFVNENLYLLSAVQALSIIIVLNVALSYHLPVVLDIKNIFIFVFSYLFCSAPFVLGSMVLSVLFLNQPNKSGMIYGADLLGAAAGCISCLIAISYFSAPQVILISSVASIIAAMLFILPKVKIFSFFLLFVALILFIFSNSLFKVIQIKSFYSELSRITVYPRYLYGEKNNDKPFGWGLSDTYKTTRYFISCLYSFQKLKISSLFHGALIL